MKYNPCKVSQSFPTGKFNSLESLRYLKNENGFQKADNSDTSDFSYIIFSLNNNTKQHNI